MSSTTAASPNIATITLAAGETLEEYFYGIEQGIVVAIIVSCCFAIVVWDYILLLPEELSMYKMMVKDWRTLDNPTTYLFLILRYAGILSLLPPIFFTSAQSGHCQWAVISSQVGVVLATASSGALFIYRIVAMWKGNKIIYAAVWFVYLLMLGCWIAVASQYKATTGPATAFLTNCKSANLPGFNAITWGSSVLFDSLILALTLGKLRPSLKTTSSPVSRQIFRDALKYFLTSTVANIIVLSLESMRSTAPALKPATIPFGTVFTVAVGQRIYLNLRLLEKRRRKEMEDLPLSGVANTSNAGNYSSKQTTRSSYQHPKVLEELCPEKFGQATYTVPCPQASDLESKYRDGSFEKSSVDYPVKLTINGRSPRSPEPGEIAVQVEVRID